ncbi:MAG: glycosyltransferase family 4 protein [Bacteroidota bacterium]|nr:glycosyltransferase family 4 protein [Bacteroidota bacterium]
MKRIFVCVSNDVYNDNRVKKTCTSLYKFGLEVHLLCLKSKYNTPNPYSNFVLHPIKHIFKKNFPYYAELNIRIFFSLLFKPLDIIWANDLDTLLGCFLVSKLRNKPIIYDSHEMFCQVAELQDNPKAQKVWLGLEKFMLPKLKYVITVCEPIKDYFKERYNIEAKIVRNIPLQEANNSFVKTFPMKEKIIVWQGATNIDRSLEDIVLAMKNIEAKLYIMGRGDIIKELEKIITANNLENKVILTGRLTFEQMMAYTKRASIGLSLDRPTNENYRISLPNKIFEYINTSTPIICTPLPEIKKIVEKYNVGCFIQEPTMKNISQTINSVINNNELLQTWSNNSLLAQKDLSWQNEEKAIFEIIQQINK